MKELLKPILKQRVVQLLSRTCAGFLIGLTGWNAAHADGFIDSVATVAVAAAFYVVDIASSRVRRKAIANGEIEVK